MKHIRTQCIIVLILLGQAIPISTLYSMAERGERIPEPAEPEAPQRSVPPVDIPIERGPGTQEKIPPERKEALLRALSDLTPESVEQLEKASTQEIAHVVSENIEVLKKIDFRTLLLFTEPVMDGLSQGILDRYEELFTQARKGLIEHFMNLTGRLIKIPMDKLTLPIAGLLGTLSVLLNAAQLTEGSDSGFIERVQDIRTELQDWVDKLFVSPEMEKFFESVVEIFQKAKKDRPKLADAAARSGILAIVNIPEATFGKLSVSRLQNFAEILRYGVKHQIPGAEEAFSFAARGFERALRDRLSEETELSPEQQEEIEDLQNLARWATRETKLALIAVRTRKARKKGRLDPAVKEALTTKFNYYTDAEAIMKEVGRQVSRQTAEDAVILIKSFWADGKVHPEDKKDLEKAASLTPERIKNAKEVLSEYLHGSEKILMFVMKRDLNKIKRDMKKRGEFGRASLGVDMKILSDQIQNEVIAYRIAQQFLET